VCEGLTKAKGLQLVQEMGPPPPPLDREQEFVALDRAVSAVASESARLAKSSNNSSNSSKMKKKKGKGMGVAKARLFCLHAVLVADGLRAAYLVDAAPMSAIEASAYLSLVVRESSAWAAADVCVLAMGMDVVLVRADAWQKKVQELTQSAPSWDRVLVDLRGPILRVLSAEEEVACVRAELLLAVQCVLFSGTGTGTARLGQLEPPCPVLAAGWLLDYPVIYVGFSAASVDITYSSASTSVSGGPSLLAMLPLQLLQVSVDLSPRAIGAVPGAPTSLELLQCTAPVGVISAAVRDGGRGQDGAAGGQQLMAQLGRGLEDWAAARPSSAFVTAVSTSWSETIIHSTVAM
jgi:hypothetical protein